MTLSQTSKKNNSSSKNHQHTNTIQCGISRAFINKHLKPGNSKAAFSTSFQTATATLDALVDHITTGGAIALGSFENNRRKKSAFVQSQLLALDLDDDVSVDDALDNAIIRQYAFLVHPSASSRADHRKTRVLFILDTPVTDGGRYEAMLRGIIQTCDDLKPDHATTDRSRFFYGSNNTTDRIYINLDATLPLTVAGGFTIHEALDDNDKHDLDATRDDAPLVAMTSDNASRYEKYAAAALERSVNDLASTASSRHEALIKTGTSLFAFAAGGWPGISYDLVERELHRAMSINGYCSKVGEREVQRNIDWSRQNATPKPVVLPSNFSSATSSAGGHPRSSDESAPDTETESTPPVEAITDDAIHVNLPKIAHIPRDLVDKPGCYLIQSPKDTAKTGLLVDMAKEHLKGLTTLHTAHRTALVDSIAFRHGCYSSNDMMPDMQTQHEVFATCLPSILNQIIDGQLRQIDVITLDEIEQMLSALFAPELKHKRLQIFSTLVALIRQATYVYALDADASEVAYQFLKFCRDDVTVIINDYRDTSRKFRKFKSEEAVIDYAGDLLLQNTGIVAVNCSSEKKARKIGKRLAHLINDESTVLVVCKANEHEPHIREFLRNPDGHLNKYRAVVYTSKMGTGVDITTPIRAALGIYDRQPLTAFDQQQGIMRFRAATEYGAWVTEVEQNYVTDETALLDRWLEAEAGTRQTVSIFDVNGNDQVKEMRVRLARLRAAVQGREHRSKSNLHAHFYALAAEQFTIVGEAKDISSTDKSIIKDDLKMHGEALVQERDDCIKAAELVDSEDYKKHAIRGTVTPEIEAGHQRWLIETTFHQDIDQQIIDDYDDGRGAARLKLLESLYKNEDSAKLRDTEELLANLGTGDLTHATMKRRLLLHAIRPFLNEDRQLSADTRIDLEDINDHLGQFRDDHEDDIRRYFKWRTDYDTKPINLLRFLLKECGLRLARYKRTSEYHIEAETLERMERYIDQRLGLQKSGKIDSAIARGG